MAGVTELTVPFTAIAAVAVASRLPLAFGGGITTTGGVV